MVCVAVSELALQWVAEVIKGATGGAVHFGGA
jgi:hypothetical protein